MIRILYMSRLKATWCFGSSFGRPADMALDVSSKCRPSLVEHLLRMCSTFEVYWSFSGPFRAIIRCRPDRKTHSTHIRGVNKTLLGHPSTTFRNSVRLSLEPSTRLSTISSLTPYIEPQCGDDTDPRLNQTVACAEIPEKHSFLLDSTALKCAPNIMDSTK